MLIEFTVGNYRSFAEPATLSMVAANIKSKNKQLDSANTFRVANQPQLLTAAAIYGANASGKSNFVRALRFMRQFVMRSTNNTSAVGAVDVEPFRLRSGNAQRPSHFEVAFILEGQRYRYGFDVDRERVIAEWLYHVPSTREAKLFERKEQEFTLSDNFREGQKVEERTRPNALFLSVVAEFNGSLSLRIVQWFRSLGIHSGLNDSTLRRVTERRLQQPADAQKIVDLVRQLDVGIADIRVVDQYAMALNEYLSNAVRSESTSLQAEGNEKLQASLASWLDAERKYGTLPLLRAFVEHEQTELEGQLASLSPDLAQQFLEYARHARGRDTIAISTIHTKYDEDGGVIGEEAFNLDHHESEGTKKLFALAGYLVEVLQRGTVLIVDELDARLHPIVTREIVKLFCDPGANPHHAQLLFTTQDTNLLDKDLLRRDQIWFVEKDSKGASHLYSLVEFAGVRNDLSIERNYIQGRFGAIPYVGDLAHAISERDISNEQ
jgi:AAA15 family ATPase/GTPase